MKTILLCSLLCLALALTAAAADVGGKWSGTFTPESGDGGSAYVILKQTGSTITGTGGPDADHQWPGLQGKIDGNKVTFEVKSTDDGTIFKGTLVLDGDHLNGDVESTSPDGQSGKAKLNLTRVTQ
jgi:opacity protein-like surface antigen